MKTNEPPHSNDWLKPLFNRLPQTSPSPAFRRQMMLRIERETKRRHLRNACTAWLSIIGCTLIVLGLGVAALLYVGLPRITWTLPPLPSLPFYLYIGALTLLLLAFDHLLRQTYKKRHH